MRFVHETLPQRIVFGSGGAAAALAAEATRLSAQRAMLICSPREAVRATTIAADVPVVLVHTDVAMHVPVEVAARARAVAADNDVDLLVCFGGGSAIGLAKAIALTYGLPIVAVPTTYSGSEATAVWGLTEDGRKTTGTDPRVLPTTIVYDAELTLSLPVPISVASGLNALAHSVDAMWAPKADPIDRALAAEGARALRTGLPRIVDAPSDLAGREDALYAAYLSATAFSSAGSGLHHKICHVLGGMFDLPHAQTHTVVLPHVLAFNVSAAPDADRRLAAAFGSDTAVDGLAALYTEVGAPSSLRDLGMPENGIDRAADAVLQIVPAGNPRDVTASDLRRIIANAWSGAAPDQS